MERPVSFLPSNFGNIATEYARDVVTDKLPSCKWHKLACERHLNNLYLAEKYDSSSGSTAPNR